MKRKLGVTVMVVLALTLAGCTTSAVRPTGVVTGVADPCEGHPVPPGEILHVKVSIVRCQASSRLRPYGQVPVLGSSR